MSLKSAIISSPRASPIKSLGVALPPRTLLIMRSKSGIFLKTPLIFALGIAFSQNHSTIFWRSRNSCIFKDGRPIHCRTNLLPIGVSARSKTHLKEAFESSCLPPLNNSRFFLVVESTIMKSLIEYVVNDLICDKDDFWTPDK